MLTSFARPLLSVLCSAMVSRLPDLVIVFLADITLTGCTPGLLHRNVCPAPVLLHNRKCPGTAPINDDVPGAGLLYQLALKHENC